MMAGRKELSNAGLQVDVFIWDSFHDRHLITDIIGIQMSNGFDVLMNKDEETTWSRLAREVKDEIQKEFDPVCKRHHLHYHFVI
jgi:hypothetical protein